MFEVFVVLDPVTGSCTASNGLLEPTMQGRTHHIRFAGLNFSMFLTLGAMPQGQRCNGLGLLQA